jgi:hypothetical protein
VLPACYPQHAHDQAIIVDRRGKTPRSRQAKASPERTEQAILHIYTGPDMPFEPSAYSAIGALATTRRAAATFTLSSRGTYSDWS